MDDSALSDVPTTRPHKVARVLLAHGADRMLVAGGGGAFGGLTAVGITRRALADKILTQAQHDAMVRCCAGRDESAARGTRAEW